MALEPYLRLYRPPMKGVCLEWYFPGRPDDSKAFIDYIYLNCPREFGWFHQGGSDDKRGGWHLIEFWQWENHEIEIRKFCFDVSEKFTEDLEVNI